MNERDMRIARVERALGAAYRDPQGANDGPSEAAVQRIVMRVRARVRSAPEASSMDARFLWRFLSACAVAAAALVVLAITNVPGESLTLNPPSDDMVATVLNPTMPF